MIILIAAVAENNALGKDNQLVWHLPNDFKRFKTLTSGHHIIMGRKTFESFPKPLPNRTHIIITRELAPKDEDVYVIGGGEIYKQSIAIADKIEITKVHSTFEADTYFPEIDSNRWELVFEEHHKKDEKHNFDFTFQTYLKR
jgi:dihydrofolate reductase